MKCMSRVKETINTIDDIRSSMFGEIKKPELYLLPILSQIALSLAVIADEMSKDGEQHD